MDALISFNLKPSSRTPQKQRFTGLFGSAPAFFIAEAVKDAAAPALVITRSVREALDLEQELRFIMKEVPVWYFPDWETLPYDTFSPYQDIISRRLEILSRLETARQMVIIASVNTLMTRVSPKSFINSQAIMIKKGDILSIMRLRDKLAASGYLLTRQVLGHGEFAVRGSIVDLFPMGGNVPYRLDFFDDEIDSISIIDPETQKSVKPVEKIAILPAHEFPVTPEAIDTFRKNYRERLTPDNLALHNIYQQISRKVIPSGIEHYLPLFFADTATVFDYLPPESPVLVMESIRETMDEYWQDILSRAAKTAGNPDHPSLEPKLLYLNPDELLAAVSRFRNFRIWPGKPEGVSTAAIDLRTEPVPPVAIDHGKSRPCENLMKFREEFPGKMLFAVSSEGREAILQEMLLGSVTARHFDSLGDFLAAPDKTGIAVAPLNNGFIYGDLAILTETELLGASGASRTRRSSKRTINPDAIIRNLAELKPGEFIVHEKHGIGRYLGLETLEIEGLKQDFVALEYAQNAKMYVPISSLHLLSRYTGADPEKVTLTRLGSNQWEKARKKAQEKIRDVAAGLLELYAKREMRKGFAYKIPEAEYGRFAARFGYQLTDDQMSAITAVLEDMKSEKPMDRLICGDVGFGKTEVAMRAAFIAVSNARQVAILVPTTLLADQHYESFRDRFADSPVEIACLSRFKTVREQHEVIKKLAQGTVDIVIGTHKLLSANIKFRDLGLLIVDEEHRFGVAQKEKIKKMRAEIDILTLTATPIPRTLNLAMNNLRSLSIIATPPAKRLAVRTFVHEYDEGLIREAILRELNRGGQTYYLHNDVMTISGVQEKLAALVPEARIAVAHAQLPEQALSRIMHDFCHQRYNVLICSTIIETGLDIPTANTIIMDRADKLGLAQLHQLRGRVGRSHHQAYAYLLTPEHGEISDDAKKRLNAIASLEELGSGFILATQDLEIRGAGEILGAEQSGQIEGIGFSLYMEMLENAIEALREGRELSPESMESRETSVELHIPALLPESYVYDVTIRLTLYKRLASALSDAEVDDLRSEIIDRFGALPKDAASLFEIQKIRIAARKLGITSIDMNRKYGSLTFGDTVRVSFDYLTKMIFENPGAYGMDGPNRIRILKVPEDPGERIPFIRSIVTDMAAHPEDPA